MKKTIFLSLIVALGLCATACYDDSALSGRIDGLEERVTALEQMNSDIQSMQTLIEGLQNDVYIKTVTNTTDGYDIVLSNGKTISLKNGEKGDKGETGATGATGSQGKQGEQGDAPVFGVSLVDGVYYWTVNGEFVKDGSGNKVPVNAATPKLKFQDSKWYASYDNGTTWELLATVAATQAGYFSNVEVTETSVIFTLIGGESFEIPLGNSFTLKMDTNVACLPGTTTGVAYEISGAANPSIYCLAEGSYTSAIKKETATTGFVQITAKAEIGEGQVLVFASNNIKTIVKSISLSEGKLIVKDAYTVDSDGGKLEIAVETNMEYVAKSTVSWITIQSTKAELRKEIVTAMVAANPAGSPERSGEIQICGKDGSVLQAIAVLQSGDGSISIKGYMYPSYKAQTIDPSTAVEGYDGKSATTSASWITVESDGKLTLTKNDGIVRLGYVQYSGSKTICIIQNPGSAFLDLSFENADGDLATKSTKVVNVGTAADLEAGPTTHFYAFECKDQAYSKPVTVSKDEALGRKVASFHNTQAPTSYGSVLWRNANGSTVKSMYTGFTVELLLNYNVALWVAGNGVKNSEGNAFCYKSTASDAGNKALSMGIIGNENNNPVFTAILNGARTTTTVELKDKQYYHFVLTYDYANKKINLYVDGELAKTANETRDMSTILEVGGSTPWWNGMQMNVNNPWVLGAYLNNVWQTPNSSWNGNIATCRVYGSTLSGAEVAQTYKIVTIPLNK